MSNNIFSAISLVKMAFQSDVSESVSASIIKVDVKTSLHSVCVKYSDLAQYRL
jgi:hypothetical protein